MRGEHVVSVNKNRGSVALLGLHLVARPSATLLGRDSVFGYMRYYIHSIHTVHTLSTHVETLAS